MKRTLYLLAAGLMVGVIMIGCSTEDPWEPTGTVALNLVIISGPEEGAIIPHSSNVSFYWGVQGGSGEYQGYQWWLDGVDSDWPTTMSQATSVTYEDLLASGDDYVFHLRVTDSQSQTDEVTTSFTVSILDDVEPTVMITQSPAEGSYIATGSSIAFAWMGDDGYGNNDNLVYQYAYPTMDDLSGWGTTVTVSYDNVPATDPAKFYVRARDQFDNTSGWDSVGFIIQDATILYIDDYLWLDAVGNPDMPKERDQKQFYRDALEGYAFAEWDIALQGIPDTADLISGGEPIYSTIIFCADSEIGTTDGTPWYWWGDHDGYDGGAMRYHLELGGKLLLTGALTILDMTQAYPPAVVEGDFEFDWLGVDSTEWSFDYWYWFTWAMKDLDTELNLPDSMKIDVGKNGDQDDYAIEVPGLRDEASVTTEVIFTWGPWVDPEDNCPCLGSPIGYIVSFDGVPQTANLTFDTYSMPPADIRQTFQAILTLFGE